MWAVLSVLIVGVAVSLAFEPGSPRSGALTTYQVEDLTQCAYEYLAYSSPDNVEVLGSTYTATGELASLRGRVHRTLFPGERQTVVQTYFLSPHRLDSSKWHISRIEIEEINDLETDIYVPAPPVTDCPY